MTNLFLKIDLVFMAAWRNGIASDYDSVIRRLQVRPLRWSIIFFFYLFLYLLIFKSVAKIHDLPQ